MKMESAHDHPHQPTDEPGIPGHWVVLGMFAFAITLVGVLWIYWYFHTLPFRPIQEALGREFPYSRPLVQGGQRKMHKGTPKLLRIVMRIEFDPEADQAVTEAFAYRVAHFTAERFDLKPYNVLEIHLHWPEPEAEIKQWTIEIPLEAGALTTAHGKPEM
jgi:hypothetical protein